MTHGPNEGIRIATVEPKPAYSSMQDYGPETELLCHCARMEIEFERGKRIRALLQEDLDWAKVFQMAAHHQILALLYRSLTQITPNPIPKGTLNLLRDHYFANAVRNGYKTKELLKLLKVFQAHNIPAIPYKGPTLATVVYGDPMLRPCCDLDFLVFKRDLLKVEELLACQGYHIQYTNEKKDWALKHHYHFDFMNLDNKIQVEIHWAITRKCWFFPIDLEQLWQRTEPVTLGGIAVPSLHREDLLLFLCVHGAKESWCRLKWICDVAELLRLHRDLNWQAILEQARRLRSVRILFLGIFLANDLLDAPLPTEVWRKVRADPVVQRLGNQVRKGLFGEQPGLGKYPPKRVYYPRLREQLRDKIPVFFHYLFIDLRYAITPNAKDRAMVVLPYSLSFLYYLVRVIRLVREKW